MTIKYIKEATLMALVLGAGGFAFAQDTASSEEAASEPAQETPAYDSADISTVLAKVGDTEITLGHAIALYDRLPEQYKQIDPNTLFKGVVEQLIDQTVLKNSYLSKTENTKFIDLTVENESRALAANLEIENLSATELDEAAVKERYDQVVSDFEPQEQFTASHILVEAEDAAKEIADALKAVEADKLNDAFAKMAEEKSKGPSAPNGGDLGTFSKGQMVPEFEAAVIALEPGQVSAPVQTQFGWHVILLKEKGMTEAPTVDELRPEIEASLRQERLSAQIDELRKNVEITQTELNVDPASLTQTDLLKN